MLILVKKFFQSNERDLKKNADQIAKGVRQDQI